MMQCVVAANSVVVDEEQSKQLGDLFFSDVAFLVACAFFAAIALWVSRFRRFRKLSTVLLLLVAAAVIWRLIIKLL